MKPRIIRLICLLGLGLSHAFTSAFAQTSPAPAQPDAAPPATTKPDPYIDGIAAIVNDQVVTVSQVRKQMDPQVQADEERINREYTDEDAARAELHREVDQLTQSTLDDLVDRILIVEEFHKKMQPIPKEVVDNILEDYITENYNGDHEAYLRALKENNMTELDLRKILEEKEIVNGMLSRLRSSVTGISPDRIKDFYDKNQKMFEQVAAIDLRQITLKPSAGTPPDVLQQKAAYLVQQARAPGADFAELARQNSQDEYAAQGGSCGWLELQRITPEIRDPLSKLTPGQVSDPVVMDQSKVPAGQPPIPDSEVGTIYIFKCDGVHPAGVQPLEDVRAQVEALLAKQDFDDAEKKWIDRLRKDAYIHYNLE